MNPSFVKLSFLNEFLSRTCKQYDKIYLDCMMDRKKLSKHANDDNMIILGDIHFSQRKNTIEMYALQDSPIDKLEITSTDGLNVREFLSIIANSFESSIYPTVLYIVYPNGKIDTVSKKTNCEDILSPYAMIETIDIWPLNDSNDIFSKIAKIVITTSME